jgi:ankyrin repeat protein
MSYEEDIKAFQEAIAKNDIDLVKSLLKKDTVMPSHDGNRAIRLASKNGYLEIVKMLLKDHRVNPTISNNTPLFLAYDNNNTEVSLLLFNNKHVKKLLKKQDKSYFNRLMKIQLKNKIKEF